MWVGLKEQPRGQIDRDVGEVVHADGEEIGRSLGVRAGAVVHADPARADVIEMTELDGTYASADEGECGADGELDRCADSTEIAIGVWDACVTAVHARALVPRIQTERESPIDQERDAADDRAESHAWIDRERKCESGLHAIAGAEIDPNGERLAIDRRPARLRAPTPVRVRAFQREIEFAVRQREWPIDERLRGLGVRSCAAEEQCDQPVRNSHAILIPERSQRGRNSPRSAA
jgi:hypothetical protein